MTGIRSFVPGVDGRETKSHNGRTWKTRIASALWQNSRPGLLYFRPGLESCAAGGGIILADLTPICDTEFTSCVILTCPGEHGVE